MCWVGSAAGISPKRVSLYLMSVIDNCPFLKEVPICVALPWLHWLLNLSADSSFRGGDEHGYSSSSDRSDPRLSDDMTAGYSNRGLFPYSDARS